LFFRSVTISFDLKRKGDDGITGEVELPSGVKGAFVWKGKTIILTGRTKIDL